MLHFPSVFYQRILPSVNLILAWVRKKRPEQSRMNIYIFETTMTLISKKWQIHNNYCCTLIFLASFLVMNIVTWILTHWTSENHQHYHQCFLSFRSHSSWLGMFLQTMIFLQLSLRSVRNNAMTNKFIQIVQTGWYVVSEGFRVTAGSKKPKTHSTNTQH